MTEELSGPETYQSRLLQKWNGLDIKTAAAPLLQFADQHPFVTLFLGILIALAILPILIFCTFIIMTFMFTLLGFLLIEGTLLSIATFMLSITLFGVVCISFVFTTFLVFIWFAAATGNVSIQRLKHIIQTQVPQLQKLNMIQRKTS